jgi:hypothetical protein
VQGTSRLVALCALLFMPHALPAAEPAERYTVFVAVQPPHAANRATLQKMLQREGYEASAEGDEELVMTLTEAELRKLFQARVRMRTVAASASDRMLTQPVLESAVIPPRFRKLIRRVYFDPQRS